MKKHRKRLDQRMQELRPDLSRAVIQALIMRNCVSIDGKIINKPGTGVTEDEQVTITEPSIQYVSRAGHKLAQAIDYFNISVNNKIVLDAGLSTGGFTDCLLQRGVARVYGVDVGYGQVHEKIRADSRVIIMERTNLRYLEKLPEPINLATLDLSFISVTKVISVVQKLMAPGGDLVVLVKPQFEASRAEAAGGVIRDAVVREKVVQAVCNAIAQVGFKIQGCIPCDTPGAEGNIEYLLYAIRT